MNRFHLYILLTLMCGIRLSGQSNQKKMDSLTLELNKNPQSLKRIELLLGLAEYCKAEDNLNYSLPAIKEIDLLLRSEKDSVYIKNLLIKKAAALEYTGVYYSLPSINDTAKALSYYNKALDLYRNLKEENKEGRLISQIENMYNQAGDLYMQQLTLKRALEQASAAGNKKVMARYTYQLATFYSRLNDTTNAIKYAEKGVALEKEINDPQHISRGYYLGGGFYTKINAKKALAYYSEALKQYKTAGDKQMVSEVLMGMAEAWEELHTYEKAKKCLLEALTYVDTTKGNDTYLGIYYALGKLEYSNNHIENAIAYHKHMLRKSETIGMRGGIGFSKFYLAKEYFKLRDYKTAKRYADEALHYMGQQASAERRMDAEHLCYSIDSVLGNYKEALPHYIEFVAWREKLNSEKLKRLTMKEDMNTEIEKVKAVQEKKDIETKAQQRRQMTITFFVILILAIVLVFLVFVFRSLKITKKQKQLIEIKEQETLKQKHLVEEKQQEILDSITYAKRLQEAILPPRAFIDEYVPENFILYKPKDIVAGDFYWAERCGNLFFIAAADSTGHGVPGAMVSVVCSTALSRTVKEFNLKETGKVLDKTRELVLETFEKSASEIKDGMDISLMCFNLETRTVQWSGANNPLWYMQHSEMKELKADKQPIGATEHSKPFTTHYLSDTKNCIFYLFTDGFADQFGGPKGKKFKYKQLADLLKQWENLSLDVQENHLHVSFNEWRGNNEQVDDVTILGLRL